MTIQLGHKAGGGGSSGPDATKQDKMSTQTKTANFNAVAGFIYLIDTTSNPVTATFPAANSAGQQIVVKWVAGTNTASIARSGSDTFGAAATSADFGLPMEVWEFTSSGSGQWNLTGGNKTLASLDSRYASNLLTAGEETIWRDLAQSAGLTTSTQSLRLTYFTARKSETTTQVRVYSTGTAAAPTPTLVRLGLYAIDGSDGGTLVAATANDTALFSASNTAYTKAWATPYQKVAGQRYAFGILVVSGAATPTFWGSVPGGTSTAGTEAAIAPRLAGVISGQTDLPASFTAGSITITQQRFYAAILP